MKFFHKETQRVMHKISGIYDLKYAYPHADTDNSALEMIQKLTTTAIPVSLNLGTDMSLTNCPSDPTH